MNIKIGEIYIHHKKWWNQPYCVENHFDQTVKVIEKIKYNNKTAYIVQGVQDEFHKNTRQQNWEQKFVAYKDDLYDKKTAFQCELF